MAIAAIGKIVVGIVLILIGLWLLLPAAVCGGLWCPALWQELWLVIKGVVPLGLILLGAMLVWLEAEELRIAKPVAVPRRRGRPRKYQYAL